MSDVEVGSMLGIQVRHATLLRHAGIFQTLDTQRGKRERTKILASEVDALKDALSENASREIVGSHTIPVLKVPFRDLPAVLGLARDGALKTLIASDEIRLLTSYHVDAAEIKTILHPPTLVGTPKSADGSDLLRIPDVGRELGVGNNAVVQLIESGCLTSEQWPFMTGGRRPAAVSSKTVRSFLKAHIRLPQIAFRLGVKKSEAFAMLEGKAIKSQADTPFMSSRYYLRSEVDELLTGTELRR